MDTTTTSTVHDSTNGPIRDWALFSGGHDSLASTHYCMEEGETEAVLHLDTTTGIPENQDFVIETCEEFDWPLRIERAPITLRDFALRIGEDDDPMGFPGPGFHRLAYIYLKERSLQSIAYESDFKPHYWTGVREDESQRRMKVGIEHRKEIEKWIWFAPLMKWTDEDLDWYFAHYDLPENSVVEAIHRSGECFCGAFGHRDEELIDLQANYPEHYEYIRSMEQDVIDALGPESDRAYWAHGKLSKSDITHLKSLRNETDMMLCMDCRNQNQQEASEVNW